MNISNERVLLNNVWSGRLFAFGLGAVVIGAVAEWIVNQREQNACG